MQPPPPPHWGRNTEYDNKSVIKEFQCKNFSGGPRAASVDSLARAAASAKKLVGSQKSRHPGNLSKKRTVEQLMDPDSKESDKEAKGLELWKLLPQLRDIPENILKKLPLSAVFQLNNALAKEQKTS